LQLSYKYTEVPRFEVKASQFKENMGPPGSSFTETRGSFAQVSRIRWDR